MKSNHIKLKSLIGLTLLSSQLALATGAEPGVELAGNFRGRTGDTHEQVDVLIRPIIEARKSYFAVMIKRGSGLFSGFNPNKIALYKLEPTGQGESFGMIPLNVTSDGTVGLRDATPSMILGVSTYHGSHEGRPEFTISNNNGGNTQGILSPMIFDGKKETELDWVGYEGGQYRLKGGNRDQSITLTAQDQDEYSTATSMLPNPLSGTFVVKHNLTGFFTLTVQKLLATGFDEDKNPRRIGIFLKRKDQAMFVLVDPEQDTNLAILKQQH